MIRPIRMLVAIACLAAGVIVGALNPQPAVLDLGFTRATTSLGVIALVALLIGVVAGGLALAASVVLPLRQKLRRCEQATRTLRHAPADELPGNGVSRNHDLPEGR